MSGHDPPRPERDCGLDVAAYLLGALEPHEAGAFGRHLQVCTACREEVAALGPVLAALPAAAPPRRVRAALRRRVLRAVREEPKRALRPRRRRRFVALSAPAGWLALGLAVAAATAVQLGGGNAGVRVIRASVGRAELRIAGGRAELVAAHLAPLPPSRVYELWLADGRAALPSTLFAAGRDGHAVIAVPRDLHGLDRLLVTVEPRAGSLHPTTPPVIQLPLAAVSRT